MLWPLVLLCALACVAGQAVNPSLPAPDSEAAQLASNFGFQDGQTPPPGALASPGKPATLPDPDAARLASNFGFQDGQTPPPGTFASPGKLPSLPKTS